MKKIEPYASIEYPLKGKVLKGFTGTGVGDMVTVVLKGKVKRVSENMDKWDQTRNLSVSLDSCEIFKAGDKTSLDDAIQKAAISHTV